MVLSCSHLITLVVRLTYEPLIIFVACGEEGGGVLTTLFNWKKLIDIDFKEFYIEHVYIIVKYFIYGGSDSYELTIF